MILSGQRQFLRPQKLMLSYVSSSVALLVLSHVEHKFYLMYN